MDELKRNLQIEVANPNDWFCDAYALCPPITPHAKHAIRMQVVPIFPGAEPGWQGFRLRHWRVSFTNAYGQPVAVAPSARCDVLTFINAEVQPIRDLGGRGAQVLVGRECDATRQSTDDWHLDAIGLPGPPAVVSVAETAWWKRLRPHLPVRIPPRRFEAFWPQPKLPSGPEVTVAILDGPVNQSDASRSPLNAAVLDTPAPGESSDEHAVAMGLFVRQVAPQARIEFYRALSGGGSPVGDLANALNRVLSGHGFLVEATGATAVGKAPLVVNMSLGWPPEYGEWSDELLRDGVQSARRGGPNWTCEEPPIGQSVFTMMAMADAIRRAGAPIMVFSAAGNRIFDADQPGLTPKMWARFYPAQWGRGLTAWERLDAVGHNGPGPLDVMPIVDVDRTGHTQLDLIDQVGPLVQINAPGIGVRVPPLAGVQLPTHMSGTSVATALVSGAAARLAQPLLGRPNVGVAWRTAFARAQHTCGTVPMLWLGTPGAGTCPPAALLTGPPMPSGVPLQPVSHAPTRAVDEYMAGSLGPQPPGGICPIKPCKQGVDTANGRHRLTLDFSDGLSSSVTLRGGRLDVQWLDGSNVTQPRLKSTSIPLDDEFLNLALSGPVTADLGALGIDALIGGSGNWKGATVQVSAEVNDHHARPVRRTEWLDKEAVGP